MGLFAIGDIHGCATAFKALLDAIQLHSGDRLITLGDYFNKGPASSTVLEQLIQLNKQGVLLPLRGNHELNLLRALTLGKTHEAGKVLVDDQTLRSYRRLNHDGCLSDIPSTHVKFIREICQDWYETESHIFVHATVDPQTPMEEQSATSLFWKKLINPQPHQSGKILICGHTPQRNGRPLNLGHTICLDTAAVEGQWLTGMNVETGQVWQANQQGQLKTSWIQDSQYLLV